MSAPVEEPMREYVCPQCGYDGMRAGKPTGPVDFNMQWGCPVCMTMHGRVVWLVETTDPRSVA